jgi:putative ATPase
LQNSIFKDTSDIIPPLPVKLRPRTLDEFIGQEHILEEGKLLYRMVRADRVSNMILWGPPGCGKTSLAHVIANMTDKRFITENATTAGVKDIKKAVEEAKYTVETSGKGTILFLDEIHRFNKLQQDALLPDIESGLLILIGATVHNPFYRIEKPLLSRSTVFELKPLTVDNLREILGISLNDDERGFGNLNIAMDDTAADFLIDASGGDARRLLQALEIAVLSTDVDEDGVIHITLDVIQESLQRKYISYDKDEDEHYQTISAFIKSIRGSDPDATIYYLAKMLEGGEDPEFIGRRIVISASEDVGLADRHALPIATSALVAFQNIGLPEGAIPLAHAAIYLACAPKSNTAYTALGRAKRYFEDKPMMKTPLHLRNIPPDALPNGIEYLYPHDYEGGFIRQEYLEKREVFFHPKDVGYEKYIKEHLKKLWGDWKYGDS